MQGPSLGVHRVPVPTFGAVVLPGAAPPFPPMGISPSSSTEGRKKVRESQGRYQTRWVIWDQLSPSCHPVMPKAWQSSESQPWAVLGCRHSPSSLSRAQPRCLVPATGDHGRDSATAQDTGLELSEVQNSSQAAHGVFPIHQPNQRAPKLLLCGQSKALPCSEPSREPCLPGPMAKGSSVLTAGLLLTDPQEPSPVGTELCPAPASAPAPPASLGERQPHGAPGLTLCTQNPQYCTNCRAHTP